MARFRVAVHRRLFGPNERPRNPFHAGLPRDGVTHEMAVRTWVFEARDEQHIKNLLDEAHAAGHTNVHGYTLRSIEQVPDCCRTPCPEQICRAMTAEGMCFARDRGTAK